MDEAPKANAKELLLTDYRYAQESFWKSEALGETRVNILTGIVAAVIAGIFTLLSNSLEKDAGFSCISDDVVFLSVFAFAALFLLGIVTLLRLLKRNEVTDGFKKDMDDIRTRFKQQCAPGLLDDYFPFNTRRDKQKTETRRFGGLAHLVAILNSMVAAGLMGILIARGSSLLRVCGFIACSFLIVFLTHYFYIEAREKALKEKLGI